MSLLNKVSIPFKFSPLVPVCIVFVIVFLWFYRPILFSGNSLVNGDSVNVSLSLQTYQHEALRKCIFPLWTNKLFGGHPLFAESQGGFAHPLNILVFGILPSLKAHNIILFLYSLIAGLSTYGLCRNLKLNVGASLFGALSLSCSQNWLWVIHNATIFGAVTWTPLALLMMERWWENPTYLRALSMATVIALIVFAGYPQAVHAIVIFIFLSVLVRCCRKEWIADPQRFYPHLKTGIVSIFIACGLTAVQLLPLLELTGESIRKDGIEMFKFPIPPEWFFRGLLYTIKQRSASMGGFGSIMVSSLCIMVFIFRPSKILISYVIPIFFLFQLSLTQHSTLFRILYDVLPGLDKFRTYHLYWTVALIGIAVLSAIAVDSLSRVSKLGKVQVGLMIFFFTIIVLGCYFYYDDHVPWKFFVFPVVGWSLFLLFYMLKKHHWTPWVFVVVLLVEIYCIRFPLHGYVSNKILQSPPATVEYLKKHHSSEMDFKITTLGYAKYTYIFTSPLSPELKSKLQMYLSSIDSSANLLWGIPSLRGSLALCLSRRQAVEDLIHSEIQEESIRNRGYRFIDIIGLKYLLVHASFNKKIDKKGFLKVFSDNPNNVTLYENKYSQPKFQFYTDFVQAKNMQQALELLKEERKPSLIIEGFINPSDLLKTSEKENRTGNQIKATWTIIENSPEHYKLKVTTPEPGYLFIADANYPGWEALIDNSPHEVYSANVLGKAVFVPKGTHMVDVFFHSKSFYIGLWITIITIFLVLSFFSFSFFKFNAEKPRS